jgi:hypothetical protein
LKYFTTQLFSRDKPVVVKLTLAFKYSKSAKGSNENSSGYHCILNTEHNGSITSTMDIAEAERRDAKVV